MLKVKVESMHCMSCVRNIEDSLVESDKEVEVDANLDDNVVTVNTSLKNDEVISIITSAGYKCSLVQE